MPDPDENISPIFYYFEQYTDISSGRTVGRKIGVVQEILIKKYLQQLRVINDSIRFEPRIPGASGAEHKVEFVLYQPIRSYDFQVDTNHTINGIAIRLIETDTDGERARFEFRSDDFSSRSYLKLHYPPSNNRASDLLDRHGLFIKPSHIQDGVARLVHLDPLDVRASVESKRVGAQRFSGSETLGSGIQTIEKAKQTALVAIDADLKFNQSLKFLDSHEGPRKYISVVILGNGVHWTEKDLAILSTYVDFTYLLKDEAILRYCEHIREIAESTGEDFFPFFMNYFSGMTQSSLDDFQISESDFERIPPSQDERNLLEILANQLDEFTAVQDSSNEPDLL